MEVLLSKGNMSMTQTSSQETITIPVAEYQQLRSELHLLGEQAGDRRWGQRVNNWNGL